jgi:hypothetical protein
VLNYGRFARRDVQRQGERSSTTPPFAQLAQAFGQPIASFGKIKHKRPRWRFESSLSSMYAHGWAHRTRE